MLIKWLHRIQTFKVVTFVFVITLLGSVGLSSANDVGVLLGQDGIASQSREVLAEFLHREAERHVKSGDIAGALRLWLNAHNLDERNPVVKGRLSDVNKTLLRVAKKRYKDSLMDLQYGRSDRARDGLVQLKDFIGGTIPELNQKVVSAISEIDQ